MLPKGIRAGLCRIPGWVQTLPMSFNFLFPIFYRFFASPNAVFRFTVFVIILCSSLHSEKLSVIKSSENGVTEYFILSEDGSRKKIELPKKHIETSKHRYGNLQFEKFSEGLARYTAVQIYWHQGGFFDSSGKVRFTYSDGPYADFSEGLSVQVQRDYWNRKLHFVDKNGRNWRLDRTVRKSRRVYLENGKWAVIDRKGKYLTEFKFDHVGSFHEGLCAFLDGAENVKVRDYNDEYGHADIKGGKWGYIDWQGRTLIPAQFDFAGKFLNGKARVRIGEDWKCIDREGTIEDCVQGD